MICAFCLQRVYKCLGAAGYRHLATPKDLDKNDLFDSAELSDRLHCLRRHPYITWYSINDTHFIYPEGAWNDLVYLIQQGLNGNLK